MIVLYILLGCLLVYVLAVAAVGFYDGLHGVNRLKQDTIDTDLQNTIAYLEELKKQYINLSFTIESEYKNNKIKKSVYQSKMITLDKQIYTIDQKLNKLYNSLE